MRIHTDTVTPGIIHDALRTAQASGKVTADVHFVQFVPHGSRSRRQSYDVQLGTYDKHSGPGKSRHYKNSGQYGADSVWAATYDEWGWFLAELFQLDENAIAGPYNGRENFHSNTKHAYDVRYAEA